MKTIPKELYKYFWDSNPDEINSDENASYIVNRLANLGNIEAYQWLVETYGVDKLRSIMIRSRNLGRKSANYFSLILDIPKERMRCFQPEFRQTHNQSWSR